MKSRFADQANRVEEIFIMKDKDICNLEHISWRCPYHMLIKYPAKMQCETKNGYLKGKGSLMIFD